MSDSRIKRPAPPAISAIAAPVETIPAPVAAAAEIAIAAVAPKMLPAPENPLAGSDPLSAFERTAAAVVGEMVDMSRSGFAAMTETTTQMLGVRTLSEAIEVNTRFFRRSFETMLTGSAHLSEIGMRLAAETLRPLQR